MGVMASANPDSDISRSNGLADRTIMSRLFACPANGRVSAAPAAIANTASLADYLIPTALDMPQVETVLIEEGDPHTPYGVKGVGEPPAVTATAAVVAALRAATGRELARAPVKPDDIAL